ncbi:unnamed protein product [Lymnaea stagnalis]|uniref:Uncharacterized protein n=1 Tax=Lymnaea stagnalis TaxID=6523 RepID=A0AAV2I731_LYMST
MDVIKNWKSMSTIQFCSMQLFELVYLLTLAFLPFVVAIREITYVIFAVLVFIVGIAVFKRCRAHTLNPLEKVVLITGCDTGLGNACARRLESKGFTVVAACYDDQSEGASKLREITSGRLHVLKLDITDVNSIKNCFIKVKSLCDKRGLWALINNAGTASFGDIEFSTIESFRKVLDVNLFGTVQITQAFLPLIRAAKGRVLTLTGSSGLLALPGQSALCMSKFGLEAFNDSLRQEMIPFGVNVITIRPGNFAGSTGLLNKSGLDKVKLSFEEMKNKANNEIKEIYGNNYMDSHYKQLCELAKSTAKSLSNVVTAVEHAVGSQSPRSRYLVDGGNQLLDLGNTLIRLSPCLPYALHDLLVRKFYGYK